MGKREDNPVLNSANELSDWKAGMDPLFTHSPCQSTKPYRIYITL